jgi:mannosyltransferase OCH1-like enzyme
MTKIHQVYIGNEDFFNDVVSVRLKEEMKNVQSIEGTEYRLWKDAEIQELLKENYGERVLAAYHKIKPNTFKSDIARAALLDTFGGIYVDLGHEFFNFDLLKNLINSYDMVLFSDTKEGWFVKDTQYDQSIQSALMYSSGSNVYLRSVIDSIVTNIENNFYGVSPWDATSVVRFGKVFEKTEIDFSYIRGNLEMNSEGRRVYFINDDIDNAIAGHKRPENGNIFHNKDLSYHELWGNGQMYNA